MLGREGKVAECNSVILLLCSCCHALERAQSGTKKLCYVQKWVGFVVQMLPWGFISQAGLAFHTLACYLLNSFPLHCNCKVSSWSGWYINQVVWFFSHCCGWCSMCLCAAHPFCFTSVTSQFDSERMSLGHGLSFWNSNASNQSNNLVTWFLTQFKI